MGDRLEVVTNLERVGEEHVVVVVVDCMVIC